MQCGIYNQLLVSLSDSIVIVMILYWTYYLSSSQWCIISKGFFFLQKVDMHTLAKLEEQKLIFFLFYDTTASNDKNEVGVKYSN